VQVAGVSTLTPTLSRKREREQQPVGAQQPTPAKEQQPTPVKEQQPTPVKEQQPTPAKEQQPTPAKEQQPTPAREQQPTPRKEPQPKLERVDGTGSLSRLRERARVRAQTPMEEPQPKLEGVDGTDSLSRLRERARVRAQQPTPMQEPQPKLEGVDRTDSLSRLRERARVRARALRQTQTDAEALLWSKLRARQILGLKFRRQHPLGNYFADFACIEIGLIVELDGSQHGEPAAAAYDRQRSEQLGSLGFQILRFWDNQVLSETQGVLEAIYQAAQALTPTLSRERERE
jgi:very-short-patch-repair endonuclease